MDEDQFREIEERLFGGRKERAKALLAKQKARKNMVHFGTLIQQEIDAAKKKLENQ